MSTVAPVSVSREIAAQPHEIFALLTSPSRHTEIDGSGMLRGAIDPSPVSAVGDVFGMKMHHHDFGDYEMDNTVVEFEQDRLIVWEPSRRDGAAESWYYRWGYRLQPESDGSTVVTESFDLSLSPPEAHEATQDGAVWTEAITETLERLEKVCAGG